MRCQCIICQELFENSSDQVISALDCGHTFHNACLTQWLENGSTCPSCRSKVNRKKIIHRLFFDEPEDADQQVDDSQLRNDIDRLMLEVRKGEKDKNDAVKEKEKLSDKLQGLEVDKAELTRLLKVEQSTNSGHLKTLKYYESQQKSLERDRQECRKIKQKLVTLQSLDVLLNGSENDAADILSTVGDSSAAAQNLSRQVAFLKREYEKQKIEKRQMKEHYEKMQLTDGLRNKKLSDLSKKLQVVEAQLERSEGDLKIAEKEIEILRSKNRKMKKFLESPRAKGGSSSFTNIMDESLKMQAFSSSTPKLGKPEDSENIDLDMSMDLFASPEHKTSTVETLPSSATQLSGNQTTADEKCENSQGTSASRVQKKRLLDVPEAEVEPKSKYLKITSACDSQKMRRFNSDSAIKNTNSISTLATMNIFKKRALGESSQNTNSITRKGFDGLGGHTTFVNSKGGSTLFKKPPPKKKTPQISSKPPPFPTLDGFITLDD